MAERGVRVDIDLHEVEKLSMLHATDVELAGWFDVSVRTIERRKEEPEFAEAIERGRAKGKLNLRRNQMRMAETNPAMAIWLGKNLLQQAERVVAEARVIRSLADITTEEMNALLVDAERQKTAMREEVKAAGMILPAESEPVTPAVPAAVARAPE